MRLARARRFDPRLSPSSPKGGTRLGFATMGCWWTRGEALNVHSHTSSARKDGIFVRDQRTGKQACVACVQALSAEFAVSSWVHPNKACMIRPPHRQQPRKHGPSLV
jgi:hypothetical protein